MSYLDYLLIAAIAAAGCGFAGLVVCRRANRRYPDRPVSRLYYVVACVGLLIGLFFTSMVVWFLVLFCIV